MDEVLSFLIPFLLQNFTLTFFVIGLAVAAVIVLLKRRHGHDALATYFNWFLFFSIGVTYFFNGIMHTAFGDLSAKLIGWENNGFQAEVGFASIGVAIVALIAFPARMPASLKFAALVGPACFLWGAAGTHIIDIMTTGNMSSHNAGLILWTDILTPFVGFLLWFAVHRTRPHTRRTTANVAPA